MCLKQHPESFFPQQALHVSEPGARRGRPQAAANIAVCYLIAYGIVAAVPARLLSGAAVSTRDNAAMPVGMVLFTGLNYLG